MGSAAGCCASTDGEDQLRQIARGSSIKVKERRGTSARRSVVSAPEPSAAFPPHLVSLLLVCAGAALRVWQYLANGSLWIDEAALARNVIDRRLADLFRPLDYAQVAPIGFLLIQKAVVSVAGSSELALRAFPLGAGLASLVLFRAAARRILSGWAVPFAVGLFSVGIPFVYLSSTAKQYSSDTAAALLVLLAALEIRGRGITASRAWTLAVIGGSIVWFSQSAVFVLAGIGTALLILVVRERDHTSARRLSIVWSVWGLSAAIAAMYSLHAMSETDREYFRWFWGEGFMPFAPEHIRDLLWVPRRLIWVFGAFAPGLGHTNGGLDYRWSPLFAALMAYGFYVLWRRRRDAALFLSLPAVFAVVASAASIYPFTARLLAFLIPFLLLATAAGAAALLSHQSRTAQVLSPIVLAIVVGSPLFAIAQALPPSRVQHLRPALAHLSRQRQAADKVYVYYGADLAFGYYAPLLGIPANGVVRGTCDLRDPRHLLRELDALRGEARVWVVMTHLQRAGERELTRGYLDHIGRRLESIFIPASSGREIEHAYVDLYDLREPAALNSTAAESFPLPEALEPVSPALQKWGCYGITGGEPSVRKPPV